MTPHNKASVGDIAPTVLFPGDPLRAKYIADNFLTEVKQFNSVRNMFGYTGLYKGKKISVMGSGMGMASLGIYAYELFTTYKVENIIRVGTCGAYLANVNVRDLIIVQGASTDSNFAYQYQLPGTIAAISSYELLEKAVNLAKERKIPYHVGNILSSDIFYNQYPNVRQKWASMGVLGVEMESYALFLTALSLGKKALTILTVSDSLVTGEATTPEEREVSFRAMMEVALNI
jgi:purine-nucleoside phosphorylase